MQNAQSENAEILSFNASLFSEFGQNAEKVFCIQNFIETCCFFPPFRGIMLVCAWRCFFARLFFLRTILPNQMRHLTMIYDLQKANIWKRASAYIFDFILLGILAVGIGFLLSLVLGYDTQIENMEKAYIKYEEKYSIDLNISTEEYEKLSEEEKAVYETANKDFSSDPEITRLYSLLVNLTLIIVTFGILISYLLLEVLVPLLFKNGQTVGKKVFGVAVMRADGVKLSFPLLFIRTVLGKFTIETMFPLLLLMMVFVGALDVVGVVVVLLLGILQIVALIASRTNSAIHDLISGTVTVDLASQMIFDTPEALIEYKKKVHAESAEKATY